LLALLSRTRKEETPAAPVPPAKPVVADAVVLADVLVKARNGDTGALEGLGPLPPPDNTVLPGTVPAVPLPAHTEPNGRRADNTVLPGMPPPPARGHDKALNGNGNGAAAHGEPEQMRNQ
jgi:hypothetical protein